MNVRYLGHSAFLIEDILIDPYLSGNPKCMSAPEEIECSIICLTHDHHDHVGDAFEIGKRNNAVIVAINDFAKDVYFEGVRTEGMNIGGKITIGDWDIKMVEALHSSNKGHPAGFILKHRKFNRTVYHAGDTGLFSDMRLIGDEGIDIAMLPIGDRYTMGIEDAAKAVEFIKPGLVIPMHYGTFPAVEVNPEMFKNQCPVEVRIFQLGEENDL
ncbi:MAG: metal-dependent hydrolase [Methanosarcinales archaeon]|nr:metal-dependent hydrolase [Methanosarcinales archaeon]